MKLKHILFICLAALAFTACKSGDITNTTLNADGSWSQTVPAVDGLAVTPFLIEGCFEQLEQGCTQDTFGDPTGVGVPMQASYLQPLCSQTYRDGHFWFHGCTALDFSDDLHGCWPGTVCVTNHSNHGDDPTVLKPLNAMTGMSATAFRDAAAEHGVDVTKKQARRVVRSNR